MFTGLVYLSAALEQGKKVLKTEFLTIYFIHNFADTQTPTCQFRGNQTESGFINFCTSCVTTTDLGEEIFPRYINEIVCNVEPCLTVNRNRK